MATTTAILTTTPQTFAGNRRAPALAAGATAALIWAFYQVLTHRGLSSGGFAPLELTLFRFGLPGLLLLPIALPIARCEGQRLGVWRLAALALVSGPLLGMSTALGYRYAPLAHGAVLFPASTTLAGVLLSRWLLGAQQSRLQRVGLGLIVAGLLTVGGVLQSNLHRLIGDGLFLISGLLWGLYTVLLRRWQISGLHGAALAGAGATLMTLALYATLGEPARLLQHPTAALATQVLFQGVLAGVVAVVAYGFAVQRLGAANAALFPSSVPLLALLLGWLAFGATISTGQWLGLAITTIRLVLAAGWRPARRTA